MTGSQPQDDAQPRDAADPRDGMSRQGEPAPRETAAEHVERRDGGASTAHSTADSAASPRHPRLLLRGLQLLLLSPLLLVTGVLERLFSRRGLAIATLGLLTVLSVSPWLRPAVSRDLRPLHIPIGMWAGSEFDPAGLMAAERRIRLDGIALPLLLVCGTGVCCVLIDPKLLHVFCGMVAVLSIAGTAAMMLNHPMLIEELDNEIIHRRDIRSLMRTHGDFLLSSRSGPRIELRHQHNGFIEFTTEREDPSHAWFYLAWCPWIIMVALFCSGAAAGGDWRRRIGLASCWFAAGLLLAGVVSYRRVLAEYHWMRATALEQRNDFEGAHDELDRVLHAMSDFADTRRMWLARGRLDVRLGRETLEAMVLRAVQMPQGIGAYDLEYAIARIPESRTLRNWAADARFIKGRYALVSLSESGAAAHWDAGRTVAPWRADCLISYAVALEHAESGAPEQLEALLYPVVPLIGDRLVRADMQSLVGDAYFDAGQIRQARQHYELSMKTFCLPRFINANAQEALLGM